MRTVEGNYKTFVILGVLLVAVIWLTLRPDVSWALFEEDCRYCHGGSLVGPHHSQKLRSEYDCTACHPSFTVERDCSLCHSTRPAEVHKVGIILRRAWVMDQYSNEKNIFSPGEPVTYHIKYRLTGGWGTTYRVIGKVRVNGAFKDLVREDGEHDPATTNEVNQIKIHSTIPNDVEAGMCSVTFKLKLKEVGEVDLLGIDEASETIRVPLVIEKGWITDQNNDEKHTFNPGEPIRYHIQYKVSADSEATYEVVGRVEIDGSFTDSLRDGRRHDPELDGEVNKFIIDSNIPNDAELGEASVTLKVEFKEVGRSDVLASHATKDQITVTKVNESSDKSPDASESDSDQSGGQVAEIDQSGPDQTAAQANTGDVQTSAQTNGGTVDGTESNRLFGMGGGILPATSGNPDVAGRETEERDKTEFDQGEKPGNLSTMTQARNAVSARPHRTEQRKGGSRGSRKTEGRHSGRFGERDTRQKTGTISRSQARSSSFLNGGGIPNVYVKGILHCGMGDPRNIAIVELADGKKWHVREGDVFSNIEVVAIFPRNLQLRYREQVFESKI